MTRLRDLQENWEGLARTDALWAICSDPAKKGNQWDATEFFATGEVEVATVLSHLQGRGLHIDPRGPVLDFGCGVGRLTQALARHFESCYGLDISPSMVQLANRFNRHPSRCRYAVNASETLSGFQDDSFRFIYTSIVLQHIERKYAETYLREFVRILMPGGVLVFQIADRFVQAAAPAEHRAAGSRSRRPSFPGLSRPRAEALLTLAGRLRATVRLRTRLRRIARRLAKKQPVEGFQMEMHAIPEGDVRRLLAAAGAQILDIRFTNSMLPDFNGALRYLDHEPDRGYISKQYCVTKPQREPV